MKTKTSGIYVLLYAGCVFWGGIAMQHHCFSQENQLTETRTRHGHPTNGFRQLTNQELISIFREESSFFRRNNPFSEYSGRFNSGAISERRFPLCNDYFRTFLLPRDREIDNSLAQKELDKSIMQKLEWVIETNKTTYGIGEPIGFRLSLRNISKDEVAVYSPNRRLQDGFILQSMNLKKCRADDNVVYLTQRGNFKYLTFPSLGASEIAILEYDLSRDTVGITRSAPRYNQSVLLQPDNKAQVNQRVTFLNPYYDLSEAGEYELTFYTRNFLGSDDEQIGEYPKPCTIRFKIEGTSTWLDKQVVWPEEEK